MPLHLTLTDYLDPTRWRWVLHDQAGRFLADHPVQLDSTSREYQGWRDLSAYLDYRQPIHPPEAQLRELGLWLGKQVFGGLRAALRAQRDAPTLAVAMTLPKPAQELLSRPWELACFADGRSFREAGVRFVYTLEEATPGKLVEKPPGETLRILAAFSLPEDAHPLNLRRERYGLQALVQELKATQNRAIDLRILQYGATRATLQAALEEGAGWDVIHLSGHGGEGELVLENDRGGSDILDTPALGELLDLARGRLKLLILDACQSAASQANARVQLGLDPAPTRDTDPAPVETTPTRLPSLAQELSQRLDCAALAMRYPVADAFATDLSLALYRKLLHRQQPLPAALQLALDQALRPDLPPPPPPPLSAIPPVLVGWRAAELRLTPPASSPATPALSQMGLGIGFPQEPERFVGRVRPMLRASQALAIGSQRRGVLFHGMPGAGKTTCALELAYRHERGRFQGYVWHRAPEADSDIAGALFNFMQDIQNQLDAPQLGLTTALDDPAQFRVRTLPRLRDLLQRHALLLVLDNLENLLTASGHWRDPLWGEVITALLSHQGYSRVVLTSRQPPAGLERHPALQVEAIHALSLAESMLLAQELPQLRSLLADPPGRELLQATLRVVQGHPKLLELANALARDRAVLAQRVAAVAHELGDRTDVLDAFFALGGLQAGETRQSAHDFTQVLRRWTTDLAGQLTPTTARLFIFLCRLEPEDRQQDIVAANWTDFLQRLDAAASAAGELSAALAELEAAGLVAVARPTPEAEATTYPIHPGVAEAARAVAATEWLAAADLELGNFYLALLEHGLEHELDGNSALVVESARRAVPYLLRQDRWEEAGWVLEQMLQRDRSPTRLAFALPLLHRIVEATAGTKEGLENAGVLARTLSKAGRKAEAEPQMRDLMAQSAAQGHYRLASAIGGNLIDLLRSSGRLVEALAVAEEQAGYTRQAGLGPWTQLSDEGRRLQVLAAMGQYAEVLAAVEARRPELETLPLESEAEEAVKPWNVREGLLDTGRSAALHSQRWETALALNADVLKFRQARGASPLELAGTRFNDYGPLLRLGRYPEARALLRDCRAVFEAERHVEGLGMVYSAQADLEDETGGRDEAVRFGEVALGYSYQAGEPEGCAISHNNLANYLQRQGTDPARVLAHRLAAAVMRLQMQSGRLPGRLRNLAIIGLPPAPPAFAEVAEQVEAVAGVRFRELFERLPRTAPDGDAALAAVWQLVAAEQQNRQ